MILILWHHRCTLWVLLHHEARLLLRRRHLRLIRWHLWLHWLHGWLLHHSLLLRVIGGHACHDVAVGGHVKVLAARRHIEVLIDHGTGGLHRRHSLRSRATIHLGRYVHGGGLGNILGNGAISATETRWMRDPLPGAVVEAGDAGLVRRGVVDVALLGQINHA